LLVLLKRRRYHLGPNGPAAETPRELWLFVFLGPLIVLAGIAGLATASQSTAVQRVLAWRGIGIVWRGLGILAAIIIIGCYLIIIAAMIWLWQRSLFWGVVSVLAFLLMTGMGIRRVLLLRHPSTR